MAFHQTTRHQTTRHQTLRIPPPLFAVADALFARLDDDTVAQTGDAFDEGDEEEKQVHDTADGLDLWTVLYGLE